MTETVAYIRNSLKDSYPPGEVQAFVRLIMEHICGIQPYQLLLGKGKDLSDTEKKDIARVVDGLCQRKPIQYLLGTAYFFDLAFKVTPAVLIPRPETAELVDLVIKDSEGRFSRILDIGTGSGCIAISLAKHLPNSSVAAIDISEDALAIAQENARLNNVTVSFAAHDILSGERGDIFRDLSQWDCIVSNPPYVMNSEKTAMEANVLENEPHLALFVSDEDPLLFYRAIARFGQAHLSGGGRLYFEINACCGPEMITMLEQENYKNIELIHDLYGKDRFVKASL